MLLSLLMPATLVLRFLGLMLRPRLANDGPIGTRDFIAADKVDAIVPEVTRVSCPDVDERVSEVVPGSP